jgi:hypothetical protein
LDSFCSKLDLVAIPYDRDTETLCCIKDEQFLGCAQWTCVGSWYVSHAASTKRGTDTVSIGLREISTVIVVGHTADVIADVAVLPE